jgi:predicted PurR-regulated permease PerM
MASFAVAPFQRAFYFLATVIMTTALLYMGREVLVPLALAIMLAFVLSVPERYLERRRWPRALSVTLVSLAAFTLLGLLLWIVAAQFRSLVSVLPRYETTIEKKLAPMRDILRQAEELEAAPAAVAKEVVPDQDQSLIQPAMPVVIRTHGERFLGWIAGLLGPALDLGAKLVLVVVLSVFMLARHDNLIDRLLRLIGPHQLARTTKALRETSGRVSDYLLLLTFINACVGLGVTLGSLLIGLPYSVLWGVLSAVLRFVPYIGIWVAAVLPLTLSLAISESWWAPVLVLCLYLALELLFGNVVEPLLFGHGIGVAPVALLIAAAFWAWLWGPVGLVLSTPLTVCLVVLGKHAPALTFLEILLQDAHVLAPAARFYQRLLASEQVLAAQVLQDSLATRPPHAIYDEVLLPALVRVRCDRQDRQLTARDEKAVLHLLRELLAQLAAEPPCAKESPPTAAPLVIACPVQGLRDELALEMLRQSFQSAGLDVEVVSFREAWHMLHAEKGAAQPITVCLIALLPGGLAPCMSLCRKLRAASAAARILIGRWGVTEEEESANHRLRAAGADEVTVSLLQMREQILAPSRPEALPEPAAKG